MAPTFSCSECQSKGIAYCECGEPNEQKLDMEVVITEGCTARACTFDGKPLENMSPEEKEKAVEAVLDELRAAVNRQEVDLQTLVECLQHDSYDSTDEPCEQCGDYIETTTYTLSAHKLGHNANRPDHKLENRQKENGKKT